MPCDSWRNNYLTKINIKTVVNLFFGIIYIGYISLNRSNIVL